MFNASRIVGPAIGGAVIAAVGEGWCFMIDAISYAAVIVSLLAMRLPRPSAPRERARMLEELRSGVRYVFGFPPLSLSVALASRPAAGRRGDDAAGRLGEHDPADGRGRAAQPLGSLAAGALAERIGAPRTILAGAIVCVLTGIWFAIRRPMLATHVRPIYIERGILPLIEAVEPPA